MIVDAQRRNIELLAQLNQFEEKKPQMQKLLTMQAQEMKQASGSTKDTKREAYLTTLQSQRENYEQALKTLLEWPVFQARPECPRISLGYLNAQINFTFAEMDALRERFSPALSEAMRMITAKVKTSEQQHVDAANNMISTAEDMIERLDYMETRFSKLKELGREGFEFVRQHRGKMPVYKSDDLWLIQIEMYRHLCLSLESVNTMPEGWLEINQLVDNATVAFQSLRDAIDERSVIRLDEQIDAIGSLTEQFAAIEEHLDYLGSEYKDSANPEHIQRMLKLVGKCKNGHCSIWHRHSMSEAADAGLTAPMSNAHEPGKIHQGPLLGLRQRRASVIRAARRNGLGGREESVLGRNHRHVPPQENRRMGPS
ncbi:hypothetical protein THH46_31360 [Pseudomonas sp. NA13]